MTHPIEPRALARAQLLAGAGVLQATADACADELAQAAGLVARCCQAGGKVLFAGNGGSAADAEHLAAELVNRLSQSRERPAIAALSLAGNGAILTATANDRGFEEIFARQVEALGRPGDVLIGLSTSGRSANLVRAFEQARAMHLTIVALTGEPGGPAAALADISIRVPSGDAQRIQEAHIALGHTLCLLIERALHPDAFPPAAPSTTPPA